MRKLFMRAVSALRPHPTIPVTPWRAQSRWGLNPMRVAILTLGLFIFGLGDSLLIVSHLGNAPWTVLAQGVSSKLDISVGASTFIVSLIVLSLWIPLRERPGFGTLANIVVIASAIDIGISIFPSQDTFVLQLAYVLIGIALVGVGSSLYITCGLGPGPRDGLMTAIHHRSGIAVGWVRGSIEIAVLLIGWTLGGRIGLGTALFAILIGYSIALSFGVVSRLTRR